MAYPAPSGFLNNSGRLGTDSAVLKLDDYANAQSLNYLTTPWKQAMASAANELAVSEPQVIRGTGGHGGDVDVWSMLSVDQTQSRIGDKRGEPAPDVRNDSRTQVGRDRAIQP